MSSRIQTCNGIGGYGSETGSSYLRKKKLQLHSSVYRASKVAARKGKGQNTTPREKKAEGQKIAIDNLISGEKKWMDNITPISIQREGGRKKNRAGARRQINRPIKALVRGEHHVGWGES